MELDDVDRGILYLLQREARHRTTKEIADRVNVSASTVRNRIERMEAADVIAGYSPHINYNKTELQLNCILVCSVPHAERPRIAEEARNVSGVIMIRQTINGQENLLLEVVGTDTDDLARITDELNSLGLQVEKTMVVQSSFVQPFNHFGQSIVED